MRWENVFRHFVTTIIGAAVVGAAIYLVSMMAHSRCEPTFFNIVLVSVLLGTGAYLVGAEGLIAELTKFLSNFNAAFNYLKPKKRS